MSSGNRGRSILISALILGATLIAAAYVFERFAGGWAGFLPYFRELSGLEWSLILLLGAAFYCLDYLRMAALLKVFGRGIDFASGMRIVCVSFFLADLTPNSELFMPSVIFMLSRRGVPTPIATAIVVAKTIYMILWLALLSLLILAFDRSVRLPQSLEQHLLASLSPLAIIVLLLGALLAMPGKTEQMTAKLAGSPGIPGFAKRLLRALGESARHLAELGRAPFHPATLISHAVALLFLGAWCTVGFLICRGIGFEISYGRACGVFTVSLLVNFLSPVPGSIGVGELVSAYLLSPALPPQAMAVAILHRLVCWYSIWPPGAWLLSQEIRSFGWRALSGAQK